MNYRAIIFDYGGTLDTRGNHWGRFIFHAYERHLPSIAWEQFRDAYIYGEKTMDSSPIIRSSFTFRQTLDAKLRLQMEHLVMRGHWHPSADEFKQTHRCLLDDLYDQVREITAESREVLRKLHERNIPMAVVSNFYGNLQVVLQEMKLTSFFEKIIDSAVVGIRKPIPQIFVQAQDSFADISPSDILVVGDSMKNDILPALSLGYQAALYAGETWDDNGLPASLPNNCFRLDTLQQL